MPTVIAQGVGTEAVGTEAVGTETVGTEVVTRPAEGTLTDSAAGDGESPAARGVADYAGLVLIGLGLLLGVVIVSRRRAGRRP